MSRRFLLPSCERIAALVVDDKNDEVSGPIPVTAEAAPTRCLSRGVGHVIAHAEFSAGIRARHGRKTSSWVQVERIAHRSRRA